MPQGTRRALEGRDRHAGGHVVEQFLRDPVASDPRVDGDRRGRQQGRLLRERGPAQVHRGQHAEPPRQRLEGCERRVRHDHQTHVGPARMQQGERLEHEIHPLIGGEIAGEDDRAPVRRGPSLDREALPLHPVGNDVRALGRGGAAGP